MSFLDTIRRWLSGDSDDVTPVSWGDFLSEEYEGSFFPDFSLFDYLPVNILASYSNEGKNYPTTESTQGSGGSPVNASTYTSSIDRAIQDAKDAGKALSAEAEEFLRSDMGRLSLAGLAGLASAAGARPAYGGGTKQAYQSPAPLKREIVQGAYGPVAQYAANGGLMHAYAHGGHVNMEDGGFVMTKRAVDGAGGPRGLAALVPGARPIRGPGTGTSDSIPATIHGARGQTPARVSNGEAYVPREAVQRMGGAQQMYNLMNNLQRRG